MLAYKLTQPVDFHNCRSCVNIGSINVQVLQLQTLGLRLNPVLSVSVAFSLIAVIFWTYFDLKHKTVEQVYKSFTLIHNCSQSLCFIFNNFYSSFQLITHFLFLRCLLSSLSEGGAYNLAIRYMWKLKAVSKSAKSLAENFDIGNSTVSVIKPNKMIISSFKWLIKQESKCAESCQNKWIPCSWETM